MGGLLLDHTLLVWGWVLGLGSRTATEKYLQGSHTRHKSWTMWSTCRA